MAIRVEPRVEEAHRSLKQIFEDPEIGIWDICHVLLWIATFCARHVLDAVTAWAEPSVLEVNDTANSEEDRIRTVVTSPGTTTEPQPADTASATIEANGWKRPAVPQLVPGTLVSLQSALGEGSFVAVPSERRPYNPLIQSSFSATMGKYFEKQAKFLVVDAGNGAVALQQRRGVDNPPFGKGGLYVCAEDSAGSPLVLDGLSIGPCSSFVELKAGDNHRALLFVANNRIVTARNAVYGLTPDSSYIGTAGCFSIQVGG